MSEKEVRMIDVRNEIVEVVVAFEPHTGGSRIWVNIDGVCRFRGYDCTVEIQDSRPGAERAGAGVDAQFFDGSTSREV